MCRNIRTLHNYEPHATSEEVHAAALQYVRKISGSTKPSKANEAAFNEAVHEIAHITAHLLDALVSPAPAKDRATAAARAAARAAVRFAAAGPWGRSGYRPKLRSGSELATTRAELAAIAAPAIIGLSRPKAAPGMPTAL